MAEDRAATTARRALACLDLTNLDETAPPEAIDTLCARAATPHGPVAAVCIYPRHAARARAALAGTGIRTACVANFPTGDRDLDFVRAMVGDALDEGAEEIDLVLPWRSFVAGNEAPLRDMVRVVRRNLGSGILLKTILETGEIGDEALIRRAAEIAVEEGADFLKTSTGKVAVNATPEAARILLEVARAAGRRVGVKPAGGIRRLEDAALYLDLCDRVMGEGWARPETFRIGASALLDDLLAVLDDSGRPRGAGS
jgi:deoxyribose-phosphate aldolase